MVVLCTHGLRAGRAADYLRRNEVGAQRLLGGLEKWDAMLGEKEGCGNKFEGKCFSAGNLEQERAQSMK